MKSDKQGYCRLLQLNGNQYGLDISWVLEGGLTWIALAADPLVLECH
jgi:hypothetical protein